MESINNINKNKIDENEINNKNIVWKKGYKGFKNDLTSNYNNFQFEIGKIYSHHDQPIELCKRGFHFCRHLYDVMVYYQVHCNERYRYCEIEYDSRDGHVIHGKGNDQGKSVTSSIRIVRELTEVEIQELLKGQVKFEVWRDEVTKKFHRENDLPALIYYHKDGSKQYEEWWINGKRSRDRENDLPAFIWYYENNGVIGNVKNEEWYKEGVRHRDNDLPAFISYNEDGSVKVERWFTNGKLHRENDLPVEIWYNYNGSKMSEEWCKNGKLHRENDLPALIYYYDNNGVIGSKMTAKWYKEGELHRENDLPALIGYYENGSVEIEEWFINGDLIKTK